MASVEKVSIALSNELLRVVKAAVHSGEYASSSEVVREALREWKAKRTFPAVPMPESPVTPPAALYPLTPEQRVAIQSLAKHFGVRHLALFGSVLRADFAPGSDVDVAVEFEPSTGGAAERLYFDLKAALSKLFNRPVDLVELAAMPDSRLKREILRTQVTIHGGQAA